MNSIMSDQKDNFIDIRVNTSCHYCIAYKKDIKRLEEKIKEIKPLKDTIAKHKQTIIKHEQTIINLKSKIAKHEHTIDRHEQPITNLNAKIVKLEERLDKKDQEEKEKTDEFVSAEICVQYEQIILKDLFGKNECKYTLNKLISKEIKLNEIQTEKWNKYYEELKDNDLLNIHKYINKIKICRNKNLQYKPSQYTYDEAKEHILAYIKTMRAKEETKNKYIKVSDFIISKIDKVFKKEKGKRSMEID
jgi:chromosome segregation ATPase